MKISVTKKISSREGKQITLSATSEKEDGNHSNLIDLAQAAVQTLTMLEAAHQTQPNTPNE